MMNVSRETYFKRQTTLKEIGHEGQELLQNAKVLVIGCGGLGSPIAMYLATSGIGAIHLVDFDKVSVANLHRQVFYKVDDVEKSKVEILAEKIKERAPFTEITYTDGAVDKESVMELIANYDVVVDGTDSLPVKYLINDACVLARKPLVYGSLYKFDGYVSSFNVLMPDGSNSCNLRDAFPRITKDIPNCEEAGTMNPIVGLIALLQVNEVIKIITQKGKLLTNQLLIYNTLNNTQFKMNLSKNTSVNIKKLFEETDYMNPNCESQDPDLLITANQLIEELEEKDVEIISVIDDIKKELPIRVDKKIPFKEFDVDAFIPNIRKRYVFVCNKGITSYTVTSKVKQKFPRLSVLSLSEGIEQLNK